MITPAPLVLPATMSLLGTVSQAQPGSVPLTVVLPMVPKCDAESGKSWLLPRGLLSKVSSVDHEFGACHEA